MHTAARSCFCANAAVVTPFFGVAAQVVDPGVRRRRLATRETPNSRGRSLATVFPVVVTITKCGVVRLTMRIGVRRTSGYTCIVPLTRTCTANVVPRVCAALCFPRNRLPTPWQNAYASHQSTQIAGDSRAPLPDIAMQHCTLRRLRSFALISNHKWGQAWQAT